MHLVLTLIATVAVFFLWYILGRKHKKFHLEILLIMLGAASIMWMVDGFAGLFGPERKFLGVEPYVFEAGAFREATADEMVEFFYAGMNDIALGLMVIAAALVIYAVIVIIIDPLNLYRKKKEENK